MKQILIVILVVILLIFGYNQYSDYKRFHSPGVDYVSDKKIDLNYHDKNFLLNYYQAIEDLNSYVRTQWVTQDVDVRNPEDDDKDTQNAVLGYNKKLGIVKFYEDKLVESAILKKQGISNKEIVFFEQNGLNAKDFKQFLKRKFLMDTYKSNPEKYSLKVGDYSSFIFELQKKLVEKGHEIPIDGLFRDITFNAVRAFEEKNGLFPDGKVDMLTLEYLVQ
jgi:hypothetical protein